MLRAIVLTLVVLVGVGAVIPMMTNYAQAEESAEQQKNGKKQKKVKRYSKPWWKAYRAQTKRRQMLAARKRGLRMRQIKLARQKQSMIAENAGKWVIITTWDGSRWVSRSEWIAGTSPNPTIPPPIETATKNSKGSPALKAEPKFKVDQTYGSALVTVVGPVIGQDNENLRNKTLGGIAVSSLRRTVIDQMIKENGWVVNDYQKEVGGKKVYVVLAQSQDAAGQIQSRVFYFAEADGRIYSVANSAPGNNAEKLAQESERVINSLGRSGKTQQAELR